MTEAQQAEESQTASAGETAEERRLLAEHPWATDAVWCAARALLLPPGVEGTALDSAGAGDEEQAALERAARLSYVRRWVLLRRDLRPVPARAHSPALT